ncbi:MAG: DUF2721 domain-containing protein [Planctomycetes bacterium]|nr:DUF2721 domain-containing protein [Planctomycetota bacterium]
MNHFPVQELVPVLQIAIIPVILISGAALFLLTLTNRFGRVTDRVRLLAAESRQHAPADASRLRPQIDTLFRRAQILRVAVTLASISVLLDVALMVALFLAALWRFELAVLVSWIFMASILALAASTATFLIEMHTSLKALAIEINS